MCLALIGPGDTAIVPAPSYPAHVYGVALASGNAIHAGSPDADKFLSNVAYTCQHLYPKPKVLVVNFPHNPSTATVEPEFYVDVVEAGEALRLHGHQRPGLCGRDLRRLSAPSFLAAPGAMDVGVEFTTMSKGYNMAGWRIGFCAGNAEMVRALATIKAYYDYGIFQADPDRRHRGPAAHRGGGRGPGRGIPATAGRALRRSGAARLADRAAAGDDVRLGQDPRALGKPDGIVRLAMKLLEGGGRGGQPRGRLRPSGRRLPPSGPGREREPAYGRPCGKSAAAWASRWPPYGD